MRKKILLIDDDERIRELIRDILQSHDYFCRTIDRGEKALEIIKDDEYDLILLDVNLPGKSGIELIPDFKHYAPDSPIIMITGFADIDDAVKAMKLGSFDYIKKPFNKEELLLSIEKGLRWQNILIENSELKQEINEKYNYKGIIGKSREMKNIIDKVKQIADTQVNVMITGESGTGKDLVAKAIHFSGSRRDNDFVPVNCSSLPDNLLESELFGYKKGAFTGAYRDKEGLFKVADNGTIFLDEIGDMPENLQAKILKVLDSGEFTPLGDTKTVSTNARIISATNKKLEKLINSGQFREDLYYRLNVVNIEIPPLRERKEDILILIDYFINKFASKFNRNIKRLTESSIETLLRHPWPGNVRELQNVLESSCALAQSEIIDINNLPDSLFKQSSDKMERFIPINSTLKETTEYFEKRYITELLKFTNGNVSKASKIADIARQNMHLKIKNYDIDVTQFRK